MAATTTTSATPAAPPLLPGFGDQPPVIEGFTPSTHIQEETFREKLRRKTSENPFVPIGCLATAGALAFGLRSFKQGKVRQSQLLMRGRIAAQGFTVMALIFGVALTALKPKQ